MFRTILVTILMLAALPASAQTTLQQSQSTLQVTPQIQSRVLPQRVPRGQTYAIQSGSSSRFVLAEPGTRLRGTDCAQVPCPGSFDKDITCWKCVESFMSQ